MTALPEPPLTPKAASTRTRILRLATALFVERGYDAVSLRDIARDADVTKGAIYGHFRSKGQLLAEVIRTQLEEHDAALDVETAGDHDPLAIVDQCVDPSRRELRLLQIDAAAAARYDPDVAAGLAEVIEARNARMLASMEGTADPTTILFVINALVAGVGVQEAHGRELPDPDSWRPVVAAMFATASRDRPA